MLPMSVVPYAFERADFVRTLLVILGVTAIGSLIRPIAAVTEAGAGQVVLDTESVLIPIGVVTAVVITVISLAWKVQGERTKTLLKLEHIAEHANDRFRLIELSLARLDKRIDGIEKRINILTERNSGSMSGLHHHQDGE